MKEIPIGNAPLINKLNKRKILQLIRTEGEISRADIVKKTGLSAPTVTRIVDSLINDNKLVVLLGTGDSTGGRPPLLVKFDGENNFVIGIDIGATCIRGVLSNLNAEFLVEIQIPTEIDQGYERVMQQVGDVIQKLINRKKIEDDRLLGVGVAVGGLINKKKKIIEYSPIFDWYNVDISKTLHEYIDCPVIFVNVSRAMALGELWYGEGQKYRNFICVNVGYGIGAGIIVNGSPLEGADGLAGEFGHITMERNSDALCRCGKYGCLEALSSGLGISEAAKKALKSNVNKDSILMNLIENNIDSLTTEHVFAALKKGDKLAIKIIENAMEYLGRGIASLINVFNPEAVFIGGGVASNKEVFFNIVEKNVDKNIMSQAERKVVILPVTFGENSALMGAFSMILFRVLNLDFGKVEEKMNSYQSIS
jgi:glucokinase-like ROK family protein